jgi:hypothetical protein
MSSELTRAARPWDAQFPTAFVDALHSCFADRRAGGVIVAGLGIDSPIFLTDLERALEVRFGLEGEQLKRGCDLVRQQIAPMLTPQRPSRGDWYAEAKNPHRIR